MRLEWHVRNDKCIVDCGQSFTHSLTRLFVYSLESRGCRGDPFDIPSRYAILWHKCPTGFATTSSQLPTFLLNLVIWLRAASLFNGNLSTTRVQTNETKLCTITPPPPPASGKWRVALFGHAGNAWCPYPTLIADV